MAEGDKQTLRAAVSSCPNDTHIFYGLICGDHCLPGAEISWDFEDVETLNREALRGTYDITKISFHAYLAVRDRYRLLRTGAALGFGCGPVVVSRKPVTAADLPALRIVLPGEWTTAHLLFRLFAPNAQQKRFVRYDEIISALTAGAADVGVIIHEDRFVFEHAGLHRVADLGEWWASRTGAPIPLGGIVMKHEAAVQYADAFDTLVRRSLDERASDPDRAMPFILRHARQMEPSIVRRHIDTFVNRFSYDLGDEGDRAVRVLEKMVKEAGITT